jgi:hypothetical protein
MTGAILYRWPAAAKFGRVVPKTKFYEHATVSAAVRGKFVSDVQRITWAYKLADGTIHLRGDVAVPEIQVFVIDVKADDVSDDVLAAIDKAVRFPIIFEIDRGAGDQTHIRMVAAYKRLGDTRPLLSSYFSTAWQPADTQRVSLPAALDLRGLYAGLLTPILPITARPGEDLMSVTSRLDQAHKIERAIELLENKLRAELQLNRKVELRRQIRDRTAALARVTDPNPQSIEDIQWTS